MTKTAKVYAWQLLREVNEEREKLALWWAAHSLLHHFFPIFLRFSSFFLTRIEAF